MKNVSIPLCKALLISVIITMLLLLFSSFLLVQFDLSSTVLSILLILTYILPSFIGAVFLGFHTSRLSFLSGCIYGLICFLILFLISILLHTTITGQSKLISTLMIYVVSGTIGGMCSTLFPHSGQDIL